MPENGSVQTLVKIVKVVFKIKFKYIDRQTHTHIHTDAQDLLILYYVIFRSTKRIKTFKQLNYYVRKTFNGGN